MKIRITLFILVISFIMSGLEVFSQCEPMTPEQCPDPENNGTVCPDTLQPALLSQFYSQVATIKPPAVYYLPPDSSEINLHHVKLTEVGNLPTGLGWQSNSPDSIFNAGEYYCILLEGQPQAAGIYPLRITVDVFVLVFGVPVKVATVTDSTSLFMEVFDDFGFGEFPNAGITSLKASPNPFRDLVSVDFTADFPGAFEFEVYTVEGRKIDAQAFQAVKGENRISWQAEETAPGLYFFLLKSEFGIATGKILRRP